MRRRRKVQTPATNDVKNFVITFTSDSVFGSAIIYRTEKLKNAFYVINLPAPEFGSEIVL